MGHASSEFSMCFVKILSAIAPDDKLFGFFVYFPARRWHAIAINVCEHNVLYDSHSITLERLLNLALETLPRVMLLSLVIAKFSWLLIVDLDGLLLVLFGD